MASTCQIVETVLRAESSLDEQLHAGTRMYVATGEGTVQTSGLYLYPVFLCIFGFVVPQLIVYYEESRYSPKFYETTIFFAISHIIGLLHLNTPKFIEIIYSFFAGRPCLFQEELPEPVANSKDTWNVLYQTQ